MLPLPKLRRPPKPPDAKVLYAESDALKLPPPPTTPKPVEQKEVTYALARRHRKTGYPRVLGPIGVGRIPVYFCDRAKEIAEQLKIHKRRFGKTRHYYDTCEFYDNNDPNTWRLQGIYHGYYNEYWQTLAKADECLKINPKDYKAMLLKADTLFRMCNFENALLIYSNGINLRFPYKNWFQDGYFRTTALLYNLTSGQLPVFYGGNMRVFHRLVQGQERTLKMFNDTYKHYDEIYPLEPNLNAQQSEINMYHVSKPAPPANLEHNIKMAAIQQLHCAKKILGGFWDHKMEVERHLIQKQYHLPRFGRKNQTEKIEKALLYLKGRVDQFEVVCAFLRNHALRQYDRPKDWMIEYGNWMKPRRLEASVPRAKTGGMENSRYRWAFSQTLFDVDKKQMDVCWVRKLHRYRKSDLYKKHGHIFGKAHPWRHFLAQKSARYGALAALRNKGDSWAFMKKLKKCVWDNLEKHAPLREEVELPTHIREISTRIDEYISGKENQERSTLLVMPTKEVPRYTDRLYYEPEINVEQYEKNREMLKDAIQKSDDKPLFAPQTPDTRPIPARLLEVFETRVHDVATAWDSRRKISMELREELAQAEAVRAAHATEKRVLFSSNAKKEKVKTSGKKRSDADLSESGEGLSIDGATSTADSKKSPTSNIQLGLETGEEKPDQVPPGEKERTVRKQRDAFKYGVLKKNLDGARLGNLRIQRRLDRSIKAEPVQEIEPVKERVKTAEELEAERLLAAKNETPFEIAKRKFDNQKSALLEKAYAVLMTCTRISEFLELELEIGNLLDETFPPESMRFPNGEPIELEGHPPPSDNFVKLSPETLGSTIKKKRKKQGMNDAGKLKPVTGAEADREAAAVKALKEEKGRRESLRTGTTPLLAQNVNEGTNIAAENNDVVQPNVPVSDEAAVSENSAPVESPPEDAPSSPSANEADNAATAVVADIPESTPAPEENPAVPKTDNEQ